MSYRFPGNYNFSSPGVYQVKIYTRLAEDVNYSNDTLKYNLEVYGKPAVDLGNDIVANVAEFTLTAPHGYAAYEWQNGSTSESFVVDQQGEGLYYVNVTDNHQCSNSDSIYVKLNVTDIALSRILSPATSCISSDSILVSVRLKNTGNLPVAAGQMISLNYLFEGGVTANDSILLRDTFQPGDSIDFAFHKKAKVIRGTWYNFRASLENVTDMRASNNTLIVPVGIFNSPVINFGEDYRIIAAVSYTLDAGPGYSSYLWNDGSTGRTMTINTPGINKCSVLVTDINGCTAFDEISIMMTAPDIGITGILNPVTSCTSEMPGHVRIAIKNEGNWDIDMSAVIFASYSISGRQTVRENVVLNSVFEKGSVIYYSFTKAENFNIAGVYSIVVTIEYGPDLQAVNNTLTSDFTFSQSPEISFNLSDTLIISGPMTLSVPTGYASYRWQDGSPGNNYEIRQFGASMYTVEVAAGNGCVSGDRVFVIYDSPDMGITRVIAPVTSCNTGPDGKTVYIEVINNGFLRIPANSGIPISYSINNGNSLKKTIFLNSPLEPSKSGILTFESGYDFPVSGIYQLKINLENGDKNLINNSIESNVTIWKKPVVDIGRGSDTLNNVSLPIKLDAGPGNASYLWQDNTGKSILEATRDGLYWVKVTDNNGCYSYDSVYVISGELKEFPGKITIYPNPVNEILHLKVEMNTASDFELGFFNLAGSILYSEDFSDIQNADLELDVRRYPPGIYFLRVRSGKSKQVLKVIVN
jgi:hypothetical protein